MSHDKKEPACLFNIIFYVESKSAHEAYQQFLESLRKRFPCRAIFIVETPDGFKIENEKPKMPCDQVTIFSSEETKSKLPFLILTYLLADLPIYVIWAQDLTKENVVLLQLRQIATKIVFDPLVTLSLKEYARQLLRHIEHGRCGISDFSWFSSIGWRELFADIFSSQARIDQLFHAKIIRIKYSASADESIKRPEMPALYFQAWLASQLNWKVLDIEPIEGNIRICYERFLYDTIILLTPEPSEGVIPGMITSCEIESSNSVHFLFKKQEKSSTVRIWISSKESCEIPFQMTLSKPSKEQFVINELFSRGTNQHYHNMLKLLYQIQWNDLP